MRVYDLIFLFFGIGYFPHVLIKRKWHKGFWFRFACMPKPTQESLQHEHNIWIHAVSVGEVLAVVDLIRKLKDIFPSYQIVCSTVTKTGYGVAQTRLKDICQVIYAPLDFSWIVNKFLRVIKPKVYISTETEIWPNLYLSLHEAGVPIVMINGRLSDRSFQGYKRIKILIQKILRCIDIFLMQSELDAERMAELGAERTRINIIGNLKFDNLPYHKVLRGSDFGFHDDDILWVAGSTHPGEEEILMNIYQGLGREFPLLRLILCPRHVERTEEVFKMVRMRQFQPIKFSEFKEGKTTAKTVVIVDTIGHLKDLYSVATLVFIGKTFCVGGGQNMIEPAFFGKPVLVGPMTGNFKDAVRIFLEEKAIIQVSDKEELLREMRTLLKDPQQREEIGSRAKRIVERYQGATMKTVQMIIEILRTQEQKVGAKSI